MPYTSGTIIGTRITNFSDMGIGIVKNNGLHVKFMGSDSYYLSTDSSLTAHPLPWAFSTLSDGMLIDQGEYYWVKSDLSSWIMENDQYLLIDIQNVTVLNGYYPDAVIIWWLDTDRPYQPLDFYGKDSDLGLTLPTSSDTGGYAVTPFDIFGSGTGSIAVGDISAGDFNPNTDSLVHLSELKEISPIPTLSGWVWMESGSDFGYSLDEGDSVYFLSFGPVWYYNFTTGLWDSEGPVGGIYINWPFYYALDTDTLWFVLPPPGDRFWVYHFSTGEWEVLPTIIP